MDRFATEQDFLNKVKFCNFFVRIDESRLEVEEMGDSHITANAKNKDLRLTSLGSIGYAPLGQLRLQSASDSSFTGYYVDYANDREGAKQKAVAAARAQHQKMMRSLDERLAKMQSTELEVIRRCRC